MKIKKYLLAAFITILGLFLSIGVKAAENEQSIRLTLQCDVEEMQVSLYQIAGYTDDGTYELQKPFDEYAKSVKGLAQLETLDSEGWRVLAGTLENNVLADSTKAMSVMKTDKDGTLVFENLSQGLYLIVGAKTKDQEFIYTPSPLILSLPVKGTSGEWDNSPVVQYSKIEKEELKEKKIKNVTLMPLMMVAGDHACNDMAGDEEDSFKSMLIKEGFKVDVYLHGLGENVEVQNIFVKKASQAWEALQAEK